MPEAWETNARGPYITIRPGGPYDAVVTVTALEGRGLVEASWTVGGERQSERLEVASLEDATRIAHAAANRLTVGQPPTLTG